MIRRKYCWPVKIRPFRQINIVATAHYCPSRVVVWRRVACALLWRLVAVSPSHSWSILKLFTIPLYKHRCSKVDKGSTAKRKRRCGRRYETERLKNHVYTGCPMLCLVPEEQIPQRAPATSKIRMPVNVLRIPTRDGFSSSSPTMWIQVAALCALCVVWVCSAGFLEFTRFGKGTPSIPWMAMVRAASLWYVGKFRQTARNKGRRLHCWSSRVDKYWPSLIRGVVATMVRRAAFLGCQIILPICPKALQTYLEVQGSKPQPSVSTSSRGRSSGSRPWYRGLARMEQRNTYSVYYVSSRPLTWHNMSMPASCVLRSWTLLNTGVVRQATTAPTGYTIAAHMSRLKAGVLSPRRVEIAVFSDNAAATKTANQMNTAIRTSRIIPAAG